MEVIHFKCQKCNQEFSLKIGTTMSGTKNVASRVKSEISGEDPKIINQKVLAEIQKVDNELTARSANELFEALYNHPRACNGEILYSGVSFAD